MPLIAFVDEELAQELDKLKNDNTSKEIFPEHGFVGSCLRIGLTISDLEKLTYVDVMKILITYIEDNNETNQEKKATQNDIDKLLG